MFREKKKLNTTSFDLTFYQENTQILVNEQKKLTNFARCCEEKRPG